ncbi:sensor histidine kinase, partial [Undibacterium luofuense]|uniref:sensor histidine kinase n=1 Tax=Undibacterium luofuense TaxID=2828733 RepID=UPI0030ECED14
RQQTETELRLLRAQIEPHFLFNTLGAVQQLALRDGQRAAELTGNLITFLRASLSEIRAEQVTLQEECELIRAYLHVMQVRMGARLQFAIDLPVRFQAVRIPSMLILTMVENAIKHGIEPSVNPGQIQIRVASDAGNICILTEDNGVGLSEVQTGGTGLQNSRERLQLMFGNAAELAIYERAEGGVCAAVTIPDTTTTGQST